MVHGSHASQRKEGGLTRVLRHALGGLRGAMLPVSLLLAAPAWSAPLEASLPGTEEVVDALLARAMALEAQVAAGAGQVDAALAQERYELGLYHFLVGNHEAAAETFFVLSGRGSLGDPSLQRDAEWYLAESLYQLGYDDMAATTCEQIMSNARHPYREDAVRRVLEVYARSNRPLDFDRVFDREVLRGGVKPSDAILYAVGKSLRIRGERPRARSYLGEVTAEGEWSLRARYMLAAMLVEDGEASWRDAVAGFTTIAEAEPEGRPEDVAVVDLARLALGRLHDRLGDAAAADKAYASVPDDSPYAPDRTRELAWLRIQSGDWRGALDAVESFVGRWPDHPYAAELRVLLGHLQVEVSSWDAASQAYTEVVTTYTPVRDALGALSREPEAPRRLLDAMGGEAAEVEGVPAVALAMLDDSPAVRRALALDGQIRLLDAELKVSEGYVKELSGALGGSRGGAVEALRVDVIELRLGLLARRLDVLASEAEQVTAGPGLTAYQKDAADLRRDVDRLTARTQRVVDQLVGGGPADVDALEREAVAELTRLEGGVEALTRTARELRRASGSDVDMDPLSARVATLHAQAGGMGARLGALAGSLRGMQSTELRRLQDLYTAEAAAVARQRAAFSQNADAQRAVAADVVRGELVRLAGVFGDRVMSADMGLVNVAWSQWVESGEEQKLLSEQRRSVLQELERRYGALAAPLER